MKQAKKAPTSLADGYCFHWPSFSCMFPLCRYASDSGVQQGPSVSEELQGPLPGVGRREKEQGVWSGELTIIRGSRIANGFQSQGVRQRESWLTCLD
jgi:hypothetical protein